MIAQRLRLPFTVGLMLAGVGIAFLPIPSQLTLTKELIFVAFPIGLSEAHQDFMGVLGASLAAVLLVTAGRALAIHPLAALFPRSSNLRVPPEEQHLLCWGGLRGALALALGLPAWLPHRDQLVSAAFAVVAFPVVVQGITMQPLRRGQGFLAPESDPHEDNRH